MLFRFMCQTNICLCIRTLEVRVAVSSDIPAIQSLTESLSQRESISEDLDLFLQARKDQVCHQPHTRLFQSVDRAVFVMSEAEHCLSFSGWNCSPGICGAGRGAGYWFDNHQRWRGKYLMTCHGVCCFLPSIVCRVFRSPRILSSSEPILTSRGSCTLAISSERNTVDCVTFSSTLFSSIKLNIS